MLAAELLSLSSFSESLSSVNEPPPPPLAAAGSAFVAAITKAPPKSAPCETAKTLSKYVLPARARSNQSWRRKIARRRYRESAGERLVVIRQYGKRGTNHDCELRSLNLPPKRRRRRRMRRRRGRGDETSEGFFWFWGGFSLLFFFWFLSAPLSSVFPFRANFPELLMKKLAKNSRL